MIRSNWFVVATAGLVMAVSTGAGAPLAGYSLRGSHEKMERQNAVAREDGFTFAQTKDQVAQLVQSGQLVALPGSADYTTKGVSFAFARPEVLAFVERLGHEYTASCGQPLVITSLVRPIALQPRNASPLSVHPAGMAVDLHVPDPPACRAWLTNRLLELAAAHVVDVTEEMHPHHLHVAVFPKAFAAWEAKQPVLPGAPDANARAGLEATMEARHPAQASAPLGFTGSAAIVAMTLALMGAGFAAAVPLSRRYRR